MKLPVELKYVTIDKGDTQPLATTDVVVPAYTMKDKEGIIIASGTSLADLFEYALSVDARFERMYQFVYRNKLDSLEHLENVDIDKEHPQIPGFAMPAPPGSEGGSGGASGGHLLQ